MSEEHQAPKEETYVDMKESYIDEKMREFFETDKNEVNIDNICFFAARTVEEYNTMSETKLKGQQKFEAATELAKKIIEKTVTFVHEDQRRQVVKNIYYNIDSIPQTIQFICRISNDPNLINANKWVLNKAKQIQNANAPGLLRRLFCCRSSPTGPAQPEVSTEESPVTPETAPAEPKVDKKKLKLEERKRKAEEELQRQLEELRMTPEEKEARKKAAQEEVARVKREKEEQKKAAKEAKIREKREKEEQKRLEKLKKKEEELQRQLEKIKTESKEDVPMEEVEKVEAAVEETELTEVVVEA